MLGAYDTRPIWSLTQEDPIGLAGGINIYGFANGDAVNFSDPFGLCPMCPALIILAKSMFIGAAVFGGTRIAYNAMAGNPLDAGLQADVTRGTGVALLAGTGLTGAPAISSLFAGAGRVTAADAIAGGLVSAGGNLSRLLPEIETQLTRVNPASAAAALDALAKATQRVGLELGKITELANGGFQIVSRGGVTTTIGANGSVLIERGKDVLLNLPK